MSLRVNWHGQEKAREAIEHGKVRHGPFKFDDEDERSMLGSEGTDWEAHSAHHLGVDYDKPHGSKSRMRYPMGKEGHVYSRALHGIRNAAHDAGHTEIRDAASSLLGQMKASEFPDERHIVKDGKNYNLYTKNGSKLLGSHKTKEEAEAQEEAIKASEAAAQGRSRILAPERRIMPRDAELRVKRNEDGSKHIVGYAAKYNTLSQDLPLIVGGKHRGTFKETIQPGAFDKVLKADVKGLKNHSMHHVLGRTKSGTMTLWSDENGLGYDITAPETQVARDTITEIDRRDIDGSSFSFIVDPEGGDDWDETDNGIVRTIRSVRDLFDVGPVTDPAYLDTEVSTRSYERFFESRSKAVLASEQTEDEAAVRLALYRARLLRLRLPIQSTYRFCKTKG